MISFNSFSHAQQEEMLRATVKQAPVAPESWQSCRVGWAYGDTSKGVRHMVRIPVRIRET